MTTRKSGLGRGLSALLPAKLPAPTGLVTTAGIRELPLAAIRPNPRQPRKQFPPETLAELAASITAGGLIAPLVVRPHGDGYELIAGERRFRALQHLGWTTAPVFIRSADDRTALQLALTENIQREELNPLEVACAFQLLADEGLRHEEIAARTGKSRAAVTNQLRLLRLPAPVRDALAAGTIELGHARALLGLDDPAALLAAAATVIRRGYSVRETEALVQELKAGAPAKRPPARARAVDPNIRDLEERFARALGTPVRIRGTKKGGTVVIAYRSLKDFDRIFATLIGTTL